MRKLLLTLAVLCGTVSGWAQDVFVEPVAGSYYYIKGMSSTVPYLSNQNVDGGTSIATVASAENAGVFTIEEVGGTKYVKCVNSPNDNIYLYKGNSDVLLGTDANKHVVSMEVASQEDCTYYINVNNGSYMHNNKSAGIGTGGKNATTQNKWGFIKTQLPLMEIEDLDNARAYYIRSMRGALIYNSSNPTQLASTKAYSNISNTSSAAEWAFIQKNDKYYLYSIEGKKFVGKNTEEAGRFPMQTLPLSDVQIVESSDNDYPFVFSTDNYGAINHFNNVNAPGVANWKGNNNSGGLRSLDDPGSVHQIMDVRELTDEEIQDIEYAFTRLETLTNPKTGTEYVLYDAAHKVFLDINNLTNEPGQADYNSLASLNSEKQSLYITAEEGLTWKIHTTAEGGKYLGQYTTEYTSERQWNSKVNEDQSEFAWTINPIMEDDNLYVNLQNTSGTQNGYLGNEGHANGSGLYVNQTDEAKKLKLMLHEASLVYKVVTTEAAGAVVYAGKNYANGEYIFANATLTDADIAAKSVLGKEFENIAIDEENKTVTLTYTIVSNFKEGDKFFIRNRDNAANYIAIQFDGGKLDNSQVPTTKRIYFTNGSNKDYKFCWELKAATHNDEDCFLLYNPYYDWYVGPLTGTTTNTHMSKNADGAGKFKIETEGDYFVFHSLTTNVTAQNGALDCNFLHLYAWGGSEIVGWERSANASQWLVEEVTEEMEAQWQNTLASQYNNLTQYELGTGIGQYSGMPGDLVEEYNALALPEEATAIEKARYCVYAIYEFGSAVDALVINQPETGFYRIKSQNGNKDARFGKYLQLKADNSGLEESTDATIRSIVYINDAKNLLHYSIGQYQNGYGAPATVGSTADTWQISENPQVKGAYSLKASSQSNYLSDWSNIGGGQNSINEAWTFEPVETLPVTITSAGYATFYCPVAVSLPAEGLKAYYVSSTTNDKAQMAEITGVIPANTGVILQGEPYTYNLTIGGEAVSVTNKLSGTVASEYISTPSYVLSAQGDPAVVGFYKAMLNFTVADGIGTKVTENGTHFLNNGFKAYLPAGGNNARSLVFDFGTETSIESIEGENGNVKAEVYDLAGRRVQNAQKGLYIVNGKKVIK